MKKGFQWMALLWHCWALAWKDKAAVEQANEKPKVKLAYYRPSVEQLQEYTATVEAGKE